MMMCLQQMPTWCVAADSMDQSAVVAEWEKEEEEEDHSVDQNWG